MVPNKHPVPVHNSNDITTLYYVARHATFLKTHECKNCKIYKMLAAVPGVGSCWPSQYQELNPARTKKSSPSSCILGNRRTSATRGGKNQLLGTVLAAPRISINKCNYCNFLLKMHTVVKLHMHTSPNITM